MADDIPIHSNSILRSSAQFADLPNLKGVDAIPIWEKADRFVALMEGAHSVADARTALMELSEDHLLQMHRILFDGDAAAGILRQTAIAGRYRGQDCPEPKFIERSVRNLFSWMQSESVSEIHPIEKAAVILTRLVDIWPFEIGNLTAGVMLANFFLNHANLPPFFVEPRHMKEFDRVVAQAITIETQPLVSTIYKTIKREMEGLVR